MNPKVDAFMEREKRWQKEMRLLRGILLGCQLSEELKWGVPCYTLGGKNVVLIHGFKEYCALLFHKGVLLQDAESILVRQTGQVQSARQVRFTNAEEIRELEPVLKAYLQEAIEVEKKGLKVALKKTEAYAVPEELREKFIGHPELRAAFEALTPGRQRGYLLHFAAAKQSKTRVARIEKYTERILEGKGLQDE
ncbi:hypothetical protein EPD60_13730 [Flaviaesturariibacter flavus]|uniref:YdhG-like domain-containing protein n=1 Tax=Flaviaesturariibacter flavus TaxID=2502780 RepID=A0A4R1B8P0_9BACT|nr:YdeI/OmpD-associated family protein [Flaviaesturariibacter flavus]TCJ13125.1 hypothetical protein EPD60_13730 [Flaviaesturariibacter flavus]